MQSSQLPIRFPLWQGLYHFRDERKIMTKEKVVKDTIKINGVKSQMTRVRYLLLFHCFLGIEVIRSRCYLTKVQRFVHELKSTNCTKASASRKANTDAGQQSM